ncbi:MAG: S41 family peptidase [Chloroflexi bacterium]|nr:S41 family peptidase [Chloroflexota bacterium]
MQSEPKTVPNRRRRAFNSLLILCLVLFQVLLLCMAFTFGFFLNAAVQDETIQLSLPSITWPQSGPDYPLLEEVTRLLKENAYFTLPDDKALEYGMIKGLVAAVNDPYTVFVEPPQHELQSNRLHGRFGGIGARIERDEENYYYLYPLPDSPSLKAGIIDGDRLLQVDDLKVTPETPTDVIEAAVRGPVGQKVKIVVGRNPDYKPIEYIIERAEVALPSVTWNLSADEPKVGIIHLQIIASSTPDEVTRAIEDLQSQGATHLVLDVRNNGGGLVDAGVDTARLFLESGSVIEQQYRGQEVKTFKVEKPGPFTSIPMVVLINRGTASAAEILAGALQAHGRALVVGSPSYGKDSIQLVFSLSDGSSLHVTAAKWWIPGLTDKIEGKGIQPDVPVAEEAGADAAQHKAVEVVINTK